MQIVRCNKIIRDWIKYSVLRRTVIFCCSLYIIFIDWSWKVPPDILYILYIYIYLIYIIALYTVNRENSVLKIIRVVFFRVGKFSSFIVLTKLLHSRCNYRVFNFRFFCVWRKFLAWRIFPDLQYIIAISTCCKCS